MTTDPPLFSVILPVYNREGLIANTIRSVLDQVFTDFELIIVDDGSTDGTASVISAIADPRIRYYTKENEERAVARNFGALMSTGKFLNFFDSDDLMYPWHLSAASDFIQANPGCQFFHHGFDTTDEAGNVLATEKGVNVNPAKRLIRTNYLGCDSVFVSRDVFEKTRFNPERKLSSSEDWDLWLKLISRYPLLNTRVVTFRMVHHSKRSLLTITADRVIERDTLLVKSLTNDAMFVKRFRNKLGLFKADRQTFFALCLLVENRPSEAVHHLIQSLQCSYKVLSRKRFWACVKHLVLNLVR